MHINHDGQYIEFDTLPQSLRLPALRATLLDLGYPPHDFRAARLFGRDTEAPDWRESGGRWQ